MLHSFFYPATLKAFEAVTQTDSQCAIACRGLAIAQRSNPLAGPFNEAALPSDKTYVKQLKAAAILEKIAQLPRLLNRAATSSWRTSMLNPADRCVLRTPIA
jgi:hypothetical protein